MQTMKKIKIILGLSYILFLGIFLYFLITKIGLKELTSYSFIKSNTEYLIEFKQINFFFTFLGFVIFGIIWISVLQGFGSLRINLWFYFWPILRGNYFFFNICIGCKCNIYSCKFFFKDLIKEKIQNNLNI